MWCLSDGMLGAWRPFLLQQAKLPILRRPVSRFKLGEDTASGGSRGKRGLGICTYKPTDSPIASFFQQTLNSRFGLLVWMFLINLNFDHVL